MFLRWLRAVLFTIILLAVVIPATVFIALSVPYTQKRIKAIVTTELSKLLDSNVEIRDLAISPFNRVTLFDVSITDSNNKKAVSVGRLGAGISLTDLIFFGDFVVNYVEIIGLEGNLYKETPQSPLNIENIIEALKPKDNVKKETAFRLSINSILLRNIDFSYNVLSEPPAHPGRFNRNHVNINNLRADISVPILSNDTYAADVYRLALNEASGFSIDNLHGRFFLGTDSVTVSDLGIELPHSMLNFSDMKLKFAGKGGVKELLGENTLVFSTRSPSYVTPADLACFFSPLSTLTSPLDLQLNLSSTASKAVLEPLSIKSATGNDIEITIYGEALNILENTGRSVNFSTIEVKSTGELATTLLPDKVPPAIISFIKNIGFFTYNGIAGMDEKKVYATGSLDSHSGEMNIDMEAFYDLHAPGYFPIGYNAEINFENVELGHLLGVEEIGEFAAKIASEGKIRNYCAIDASASADIYSFTYRDYEYHDISAGAEIKGDIVNAEITSADPNLDFIFDAQLRKAHREPAIFDFTLDVTSIEPSLLNLKGFEKTIGFSGKTGGNLQWTSLDDVTGKITASDLIMHDATQVTPVINYLVLTMDGEPANRHISLESNRLDLQLAGEFHLSTLIPSLHNGVALILPALIEKTTSPLPVNNQNFVFDITLRDTEWITPYINLPVSAMDNVGITGSYDSNAGNLTLMLDAPYVRQGKKLIENTRVQLETSSWNNGEVNVSALVPTKKGPMEFIYNGSFSDNTILSDINWVIENDKLFRGDLGLNVTFSRDPGVVFKASPLFADIQLEESTLAFNDSVWTVMPSNVYIAGKDFIKVKNLRAFRHGQEIIIDGIVSPNPDEEIEVTLDNVDLDYIFETLAINNVTIGGDATGNFTGAAILSSEPHIFTDNLIVKKISYNGSVVGDAEITSGWNSENRSIMIDADITQSDSRHTFIKGDILPLNDSLDLRFYPDRVWVGFLAPYLQAFSSEIGGYASGNARLWGNFRDIDLTADILADSVYMRIDFTNVRYTVSDSVIITPGLIKLDNMHVTDDYGHRARLNGEVRHDFFHNPEFEFHLVDAADLLVLDEPEASNPKWFGRVFANGEASVKGAPGFVDITCNLTTAPQTTFTFVLNDLQNANEYTFITYRDRDYLSIRDSLIMADKTPPLVKEFRERTRLLNTDSRSRYDMSFNINVTPDARLDLIMDPVGGDKIRAYGNGDIRIDYGSSQEDLRIFGTYTLSRGSYNFSLQEIIIKDFSIRDGSSITFTGDPYRANLDITAVYSLTANLTDLDNQFLEDKDISRTNVPVHALLHVAGDLYQPDISFDIEFPTLTQDTYRKVRSIISTEDMMNRQIIYLLALNRFYTPDYMQSATKGNELISVASSTLSSQLSNILGQISDKWTIAPSIKSERSDFADMEVDLALSSSLLNNRLLLNGNFGYRDKMLNTNQFVGDFDVEYLLNRKGTLRLKAYNRYNDRNFYFKTAATTQGVGVVVKQDFDSFLNFLKFWQK